MSRNSKTIADGIKLAIFTVVSVLVTGLLAVIMGNFGFGDTTEYRAIFTNASMLQKGDDVRVAGVSVGEVREVEHYKRTQAMITFRVQTDVPLTTSSRAEIRYLNLVGDRYLALTAGEDPAAPEQDPGDAIPAERTSPSLDLSELFDGFKPLFAALQPEQVNELSMNLVQVLQGEGGTVQGLLAKTASLTNTLADRDQLIGDVIGNLTTTMQTLDSRHEQLSSLVIELKNWMTDLARDRQVIGSSLGNISDLTLVVAKLLKEGRPLLKSDIAELRKLAALLNQPQNTQEITDLLDRLPETLTDQARTGSYGSWYNYYLCSAAIRITLPDIAGLPNVLETALSNIQLKSTAPRCEGKT